MSYVELCSRWSVLAVETRWLGLACSQTWFQWSLPCIFPRIHQNSSQLFYENCKSHKNCNTAQQSSRSITSVLKWMCVTGKYPEWQNRNVNQPLPSPPFPPKPNIFSSNYSRSNASYGTSTLRSSVGCRSPIAAFGKSKLGLVILNILTLFKVGCAVSRKERDTPQVQQNKDTWRVWLWGRCV